MKAKRKPRSNRVASDDGLAEQLTRAQYRRLLNEQDTGQKHKHNRYNQRSRKYGDYLYHQDREKFEVDYQEHLSANDGAKRHE